MTFRTSLPRPSGPLTLVTGFLLTASAMAQTYSGQGYSDAPSVYNRRTAEPPVRRPVRQALPSAAARTYPQGAYAPRTASGTARQPAVRPRSLYPQPARQAQVADQRGAASQGAAPQLAGPRQSLGQRGGPGGASAADSRFERASRLFPGPQ